MAFDTIIKPAITAIPAAVYNCQLLVLSTCFEISTGAHLDHFFCLHTPDTLENECRYSKYDQDDTNNFYNSLSLPSTKTRPRGVRQSAGLQIPILKKFEQASINRQFTFHTILHAIPSICSSFKNKVNKTMKKIGLVFMILFSCISSTPQSFNCTLKPPQFIVHFGTGNVADPNIHSLADYRRVRHSCPSDGYYSFASYTEECFDDDWHTLPQDHTAGDVNGNMLLVNAAWNPGVFLKTHIRGLKNNTTYEIGLWLMNLCKPTKKCPSVLLPNLTIRLETPEGKPVANIVTGDLPRVPRPQWVQHRAMFTTPAQSSTLVLTMIDNVPSGCGNDFALDDITFRECVKREPKITQTQKPVPPKKQVTTPKAAPKKAAIAEQNKVEKNTVVKPKADSNLKKISVVKRPQISLPPPPLVLKTRENALARKIETGAGEIRIDIYDNGQIDGDTVSIYHNNVLIRSRQRLSQQPISFKIGIDDEQPHHELIMVAENLGSIPPNTSIMIITTPIKRYEVFISSSEQKNAKVVFELKK